MPQASLCSFQLLHNECGLRNLKEWKIKIARGIATRLVIALGFALQIMKMILMP